MIVLSSLGDEHGGVNENDPTWLAKKVEMDRFAVAHFINGDAGGGEGGFCSNAGVPGSGLGIFDAYTEAGRAEKDFSEFGFDKAKEDLWRAYYRVLMRAGKGRKEGVGSASSSASTPQTSLSPSSGFASSDARLSVPRSFIETKLIYHGVRCHENDLVGVSPSTYLRKRDEASRPRCGNPDCGVIEPAEAQRRFQLCAACRTVRYCSASCQKAHWKHSSKGHKTMCKMFASLRAAAPGGSGIEAMKATMKELRGVGKGT